MLFPERFILSEAEGKDYLMMKEQWHVYILQCKDKSYYTGMTCQIDTRWVQHLSRLGSKFTAKHIPDKVVHLEIYEDFASARRREKQIKGWTRTKKERLISGEWGRW